MDTERGQGAAHAPRHMLTRPTFGIAPALEQCDAHASCSGLYCEGRPSGTAAEDEQILRQARQIAPPLEVADDTEGSLRRPLPLLEAVVRFAPDETKLVPVILVVVNAFFLRRTPGRWWHERF